MITLLAFLVASAQPVRCVDACWGDVCYYREKLKCRVTCSQLPAEYSCEPAVVDLGEWDPRPAPHEWSTD